MILNLVSFIKYYGKSSEQRVVTTAVPPVQCLRFKSCHVMLGKWSWALRRIVVPPSSGVKQSKKITMEVRPQLQWHF